MEGYSVSQKLEKMGWHASDTGAGLPGRLRPRREPARGGEQGLLPDHGQLPVGAAGDGAGRGRRDAAPLERTIEYALEREAFGRPIAKYQAIRHKIAEMALDVRGGARRHLQRAAAFYDGNDAIKQVTIAKLKTQRDAFDVADDALQIFGGAGYMKEYEIERAARDTRLGPDRRRHRRDHERDPRQAARAVARQNRAASTFIRAMALFRIATVPALLLVARPRAERARRQDLLRAGRGLGARDAGRGRHGCGEAAGRDRLRVDAGVIRHPRVPARLPGRRGPAGGPEPPLPLRELVDGEVRHGDDLRAGDDARPDVARRSRSARSSRRPTRRTARSPSTTCSR